MLVHCPYCGNIVMLAADQVGTMLQCRRCQRSYPARGYQAPPSEPKAAAPAAPAAPPSAASELIILPSCPTPHLLAEELPTAATPPELPPVRPALARIDRRAESTARARNVRVWVTLAVVFAVLLIALGVVGVTVCVV